MIMMTNTPKTLTSRLVRVVHGLALSLAFLPAVMSLDVRAAQLSGAIMANYTASPISAIAQITPLVMLSMSRDHQYFFKAYNDFSDVDGDGVTETTYDDTFEYYGYFHSRLCYEYDDTDQRFEPTGTTDAGDNQHYCLDGQADRFSGNFLNWATMTRMDIVRKLLYGGTRSTDDGSSTVLERAHLPTDAHSFTKYYNLPDLEKLTPFNSRRTDTTNGGNNNGYDDADEGITICNTSFDGTNAISQNSTALPTMRVVFGNRQLWASNERWQCTWESEKGDNSNSNNPAQSGLDSVSSDPPNSMRLLTAGNSPERIVRVVSCDPTYFNSSANLENCQLYPSGNRKPTGLLQRYGESGLINFGLVTGSWNKNISGGALRKSVSSMTDEINSTTNGTFKTAPSTGGIINSLNLMRMWGYRYQDGTYFGAVGAGSDNCGFQQAAITEGRCRSWGNPMSEIYLETLRYFSVSASRAPTAAFDPNDTGTFPGMVDIAWTSDPLNVNNACASLNIIAFNASVSSYDNDQTTSGIFGATTPAAQTKLIGDDEGITGKSFFSGRAGTTIDEFCTQKTVDDLGTVFGICPEAPTGVGSYHMAGMAWYARTNDMRADLTGDQQVNTYGVALATSVPTIEIPIGPAGSKTKVRVLPAYRLLFNNGGGTLVDFKVVRKHTPVDPTDRASTGLPNTNPDGTADINTATGVPTVNFPVEKSDSKYFHGKFYINWEDSEQGGDFDQDMWGTLDYVVDTTVTPAKVTITTKAVAQSTVNGQLFGFIISGTTQNGFHAYSGILGANYVDASGVPGCTDCRALSEGGAGQRGAQSHTFTVSTTVTADLLENPLFYAAKWGGFTDSDSNKKPNLQKEWDTRDISGAEVDGGDGIPDNYFFVSNPAALEGALTTVFDNIIERVASGSAAAVVANNQEGVGAVFQAVYDTFKSDATTAQNKAEWIGTLNALFIDTFGLLREDGNQNGVLDGYTVDPVIEIFFNESKKRAMLRRFSSSDDEVLTISNFSPDPVELNTLKTLWNGREKLSDLDAATIQNQRPYEDEVSNEAQHGRHILTWVDTNLDNIVAADGSETLSFDASTLSTANRWRWLDEGDVTDAQKLINWVRGKEITGMRNRIVDYDGDNIKSVAVMPSGEPEVMRLGDIVASSPISVAAPADAYDRLSQDLSYRAFRQKYSKRRQVVYVGANDGMIHAFNSGFFDDTEKDDDGKPIRQFLLKRSGETEHPLGAELWAYIPKNLLPHLQWGARTDYTHVFSMDQTPRIFDAKIFTDDGEDGVHPGGWGTILVQGMRLGGGSDATKISIDVNEDGTIAANGAETTKSAYVILDITDPESPPTLLAELNPDTLNLTTSSPTVLPIGDPIEPGSGSDVSSPNAWYLVFGSGPTDLGSGASTQKARLFAYDLTKLAKNRGDLVTIDGARVTSGPFSSGFAELNENNTFVGDAVVPDFDLDMKAEAIYFGSVGNATGDVGSLWRLSVGEKPDPADWGAPFKLLAANQPFLAQPSVTIDRRLRTWVIAGSGRALVAADKLSTTQQSLYGFIDPNPLTGSGFAASATAVSVGGLTDVTNARVRVNGDLDLNGDGATDTTFKALQDTIISAGGWKRRYDLFNSPTPSERSPNRSTLFDGLILNAAFTPSINQCTSEGRSKLYVLAFETGTALPDANIGTQNAFCGGTCPEGTVKEATTYVDLGLGMASAPAIHFGPVVGGDAAKINGEVDVSGSIQASTGMGTAYINTSTDNQNAVNVKDRGGITDGEISWREYRNTQ
jgi:type IV pilus assembly protein PilY1